MKAGLRGRIIGRRRPARFGRDASGATAVEFALIWMPLFGFLFIILETALIFWASQVLETAVALAARQLYTGQFQTANPTSSASTPAQIDAIRTKFKAEICRNVVALFDCNRSVDVDVQTFSNTFPARINPPVTNGTYDTSSYGYSAPAREQIGLVRASLVYPSFTSFSGVKTGLSNGKRLIMATATFKAEPY